MNRNQKRQAGLVLLLMLCEVGGDVFAQDHRPVYDKQFNIVFGLNQPLFAKGFNAEVNYFGRRITFDYSHGVSLDFHGQTVTGDVKRQGLAVHMPYTTGFGVGYRFTRWLNLRVEPKLHRWEIYYDGEPQNNQNRITVYNTFSLGLGLYGNWKPFEKKDNFLRGLIVAPSIRFWPNVSSSLPDDTYTYFNKLTNRQEAHKAMQPGFNNTPWVFNVSVGYSFGIRRPPQIH